MAAAEETPELVDVQVYHLGPDIEKRILNANVAYYALLPLLKSQSVLRAEKIKNL